MISQLIHYHDWLARAAKVLSISPDVIRRHVRSGAIRAPGLRRTRQNFYHIPANAPVSRPPHHARPGEITLAQWRARIAAALSLDPETVKQYQLGGLIPFPRGTRRLNHSFTFVPANAPMPELAHHPRPGETPLKQWLSDQCRLLHLSKTAVWTRLQRGHFPNVTLRRVNPRVVFVSTGPATEH